ncbi:DUF2059 domain-containing protein [Thalassotalea agarivorans]|uniref:DUF2059 domain-containing protein n=1 Tax=Thalassotalea agarivorans TaxID=349064 RepID=A0A1I0CCI8_THASX|nr:hypothetical protein [Thalassotalea agarivorans]SET16989.1 hypothetical protein SAMN05660429_01141 [Thalassotalea agarivorans]
MIRKISVAFLSAVMLISTSLSAKQPTADQVQAYMNASGLNKSIDGLSQQIDGLSQQFAMGMGDTTKQQAFFAAVKSSLAKADMKKVVASELSQKFSDKELTELNTFVSEGVGKEMKQAEQKLFDSDINNKIMQYMGAGKKPSPEQEAAIANLITNTDATNNSADVYLTLTKAMMSPIMQSAQGVTAEVADQQVAAQVNAMDGMLRSQIEPQLKLAFGYAFQDSSAEAIGKYADFYKTSLGQKELSVVNESMITAISAWGSELGQALAK